MEDPGSYSRILLASPSGLLRFLRETNLIKLKSIRVSNSPKLYFNNTCNLIQVRFRKWQYQIIENNISSLTLHVIKSCLFERLWGTGERMMIITSFHTCGMSQHKVCTHMVLHCSTFYLKDKCAGGLIR